MADLPPIPRPNSRGLDALPGSQGMPQALPRVLDVIAALIGAPTEGEGSQMDAGSQAFQSAFAGGDRQGMAQALGEQAGIMAPYMAGAGVIKAYHGSPHSFDKFRMDRIGTGEGAQAYGHGLYFADSEDVAKSYRDILTQQGTDGARRRLERAGNDIDAAISQAKDKVQRYRAGGAESYASAVEEDLRFLQKFKDTGEWSSGAMYEVNINANPDDFLDWDKPLSQQSPNVRDTVKTQIKERNPWLDDDTIPDMSGDKIFYSPGSVSPSGNTAAFRDAGIPGIKYLDQGSRTAGEGSRNYVVFDENLISIVKKYGIAGAVAAGLLTNEQAQAFMDQQKEPVL